MIRGPPRRYLVRSADGRELVCPTLQDLHALYAQGFLADDDQVRAEGGDAWVPAGSFTPLRGLSEQRGDPRRVLLLLLAAAALALGLWLLVHR